MFISVTCAGVVIGSADLEPAAGLAHATLDAGPGYAIAAAAARALGERLRRTQYWSALQGDFAASVARDWEGDRLALEDDLGRELAVNNIAIIEYPATAREIPIRLVADFRPDLARVEALLRSIDPAGGGRTRPAA